MLLLLLGRLVRVGVRVRVRVRVRYLLPSWQQIGRLAFSALGACCGY